MTSHGPRTFPQGGTQKSFYQNLLAVRIIHIVDLEWTWSFSQQSRECGYFLLEDLEKVSDDDHCRADDEGPETKTLRPEILSSTCTSHCLKFKLHLFQTMFSQNTTVITTVRGRRHPHPHLPPDIWFFLVLLLVARRCGLFSESPKARLGLLATL